MRRYPDKQFDCGGIFVAKIVIIFYTKKVFSMTLGVNLISGRFVYALLILSERY